MHAYSRIQECWYRLPCKAHILLLLASCAQKYYFNIANNQVIKLILDLLTKFTQYIRMLLWRSTIKNVPFYIDVHTYISIKKLNDTKEQNERKAWCSKRISSQCVNHAGAAWCCQIMFTCHVWMICFVLSSKVHQTQIHTVLW